MPSISTEFIDDAKEKAKLLEVQKALQSYRKEKEALLSEEYKEGKSMEKKRNSAIRLLALSNKANPIADKIRERAAKNAHKVVLDFTKIINNLPTN